MKPRTNKCPRCRRSGFNAKTGFDRPRFVCDGCDYEWSCGHSGGGYFELARNTKGRALEEFSEHTPGFAPSPPPPTKEGER